ncbi:MAG: adenylate/guanylate cyclase domain-containing protein [Candidatus Ozemobacteraceae bacterium]
MNLREERSPILWGFVFLIIIGAPLFIAVDMFSSFFEKLVAEKSTKCRILLARAADHLVKRMEPAALLETIVHRLALHGDRSPQMIRRFVRNLDSAIPGAFRWAAWTEDGAPITFDESSGFSGKRFWSDVISTKLDPKKASTSAVHALLDPLPVPLLSETSLRGFRSILGVDLPLETLFSGPKTLHETTRLGKRCQIWWMPLPDARLPSPSKPRLGGAFVCIFPERLPSGFWLDFALKRLFEKPRHRPFTVCALDLTDSRKYFVSGTPPFRRELIKQLRQTFLTRSDTSISCLGRSAVLLDGDRGNADRVFLLANISDAELRRRIVCQIMKTVRGIFCLSLCVFFVLCAVLGVTQRPLFDSFRGTLRGSVLIAFILAMLAPTVSFLRFGMVLIERSEIAAREEVFEKFRKSAISLRNLGDSTSELLADAVFKHLKRRLGDTVTEETLVSELQVLYTRGMIADFLLSDECGRLSKRGPRPLPAGAISARKLVLQGIFVERGRDTATFVPKTGGIYGLCRQNRATTVRLGVDETSFEFIQLDAIDHRRILLLEFSPAEIERACIRRARAEDKKNLSEGRLRTFFVDPLRGTAIPGSVWNIFREPSFAQYFSRPEEIFGEHNFGSGTYLFSIGAKPLKEKFRPVFILSKESIQTELRDKWHRMVVASGITGGTALLLGWLLASYLIRPIRKLESVARKVGEGHFDAKIPISGNDELARLSTSFNRMIGGLQEREKLRAYVSESVVEAVRNDETVDTARRGEIRIASVLFCDVRNFTTLSETHLPSEMFSLLNEVLGGAEACISNAGGRVDKFIGDAVMAVFLQKDDDGAEGARRAVAGAVGIRRFLAEWNERRRAGRNFTIEIGIGINTGPVMLGSVGSKRRRDLTVIGDTVNLAARLEAASKHGRHTRIVLAEKTRALIGDTYITELMPITVVKGKDQPVQLFELVLEDFQKSPHASVIPPAQNRPSTCALPTPLQLPLSLSPTPVSLAAISRSEKNGNFSFSSFASSGFLLLALLILPLVAFRQAFHTSLRETSDEHIRILRGEMEKIGENLEDSRKPENVILSVMSFIENKKPGSNASEKFLSFFSNLEKTWPGSFKWVLWKDRETVVQLPRRISPDEGILWRRLVREILAFYSLPGVSPEQLSLRQSLLDRLQNILGSSLSVIHVLRKKNLMHPVTWNGRPALILHSLLTRLRDERSKAGNNAGFLALIFPDRLPPDFWNRCCFYAMVHGIFGPPQPLALVDLMNPRRSLFPHGRKTDLHFQRSLKAGLREIVDEPFRVGETLVLPLRGDTRSGQRFVLLGELGPIEKQFRAASRTLDIAILLIFGIGVFVFYQIRSGWLVDISLRRRIMGLLGLATLLPVSSLYQTGMAVASLERETGRVRATRLLRETGKTLSDRFKDVSPRYGKVVSSYFLRKLGAPAKRASSMKLLGDTSRDAKTIQRLLKTMINSSMIGGYYLTDDAGQLSFGYRKAQTDTWIEPLMKVLSRKVFLLAHEEAVKEGIVLPAVPPTPSNAGREAFQGSLADELGAWTNSGKGRVPPLENLGKIQRYDIMQGTTYMLPLRIDIDGKPRGLVLFIRPSRLDHLFAREEFLANRFCRDRSAENRVELQFNSRVSDLPNYPPEKVFNQSLFAFDSVSIRHEGFVQIDVGSEPVLLFRGDHAMHEGYTVFMYHSLASIDRTAAEAVRFVNIGSITAAAASLLLGFLLATGLMTPINRLEHAAGRIASGNLEVRVPVEGNDELGRLNASFNEMIQGLRERERMQPFVSDTVLEAVRDGAIQTVHAGELREATILFCDVRNFTTLSEKHGPEAMFTMLNGFLDPAERVVRAHGGRVDKFIGDAIMAVFLEPGREGASGALGTAFDLRAALSRFNAERRAADLFEIDVGVGINTGPVLLGDIGSERRKDLTVIGDTVNLASRLETASKKGTHTRIMLSETTKLLVEHLAKVEESSITEVKGKIQPVRIFEVIGPI